MGLAQLAIFVRPPAKGSVKTRLEPIFGASGAAELYSAFVEDALRLCTCIRDAGRIDLALWTTELQGPGVAEWSEALGVAPRLQPAGDLGERLGTAFDEGLRHYERVVIIGSDMPTLPFGLVVAAFDALDAAELAIAPSNDGGYVLIGATGASSPSFDGVHWSTPSAFVDTVHANRGRELVVLPPWYDVDDESDLDVLRAHLSVQPSAAPATSRRLARLSELHELRDTA